MFAKGITVRLSLLVAIGALVVFAFALGGSTPQTEAAPVQASCEFATPLADMFPDGGSNTVTCTFDLQGTPHTLVVDFTIDLMARPPISIDGCTLDSEPIHVGPCP